MNRREFSCNAPPAIGGFAQSQEYFALVLFGGGLPLIAQIDAVLTDDGRQVFFYAYLIDDALTDGEPLLATIDLPTRLTEDSFDPAAFVAAFWAAGCAIVGAKLIIGPGR